MVVVIDLHGSSVNMENLLRNHSSDLQINSKRLCNSRVYCCFINFRKAFDYVDRPLMYRKLEEHGVKGSVLELIKQIYSRTANLIRINNLLSEEFVSLTGVKQGDNLSPTICGNFIDGLIKNLNATKLGIKIDPITVINNFAYADDIVLIGKNAAELQKLLDVVYKWCHRWRVVINTSKTKVMIFKKKGCNLITNESFRIGDNRVEIVNRYKYLGVMLNSMMDSEQICETVIAAGSRALGNLIGKTKSNFDLGFCSFSKLVISTILPVIDYVIGAWNISQGGCCTKLDQIQNRGARFYCGLPKSSPIAGLIGDMGWLPGIIR